MKKPLTYIFILLFPIIHLSQESAKVGTAGAQFLEIGLSARATGMAEAYVVTVDNSEAIFWNPGALARVEDTDISASYVRWPVEIVYSGLALAKSIAGIGTFGLHIAGLKTGDMRVRTIYHPEGNGQMFTASQFVGGITYSRFLTDKFSVGLTFKCIQEDFWEYRAKNWAFDIGTFYDTGFNSLVLGMSILNFGPEMAFAGTFIDYSDPIEGGAPGDFEQKNFSNYPLPLTFRFGLAMYVYDREDVKVLTAVDTHKPNDNKQHVNAGTEITFMDMLMLRAGYRFRYDQGGFCFGAGLNYNLFAGFDIRLDYSYADMGVFNAAHRGTFGVSF
jgi:opacity protein-like surface antigen